MPTAPTVGESSSHVTGSGRHKPGVAPQTSSSAPAPSGVGPSPGGQHAVHQEIDQNESVGAPTDLTDRLKGEMSLDEKIDMIFTAHEVHDEIRRSELWLYTEECVTEVIGPSDSMSDGAIESVILATLRKLVARYLSVRADKHPRSSTPLNEVYQSLATKGFRSYLKKTRNSETIHNYTPKGTIWEDDDAAVFLDDDESEFVVEADESIAMRELFAPRENNENAEAFNKRLDAQQKLLRRLNKDKSPFGLKSVRPRQSDERRSVKFEEVETLLRPPSSSIYNPADDVARRNKAIRERASAQRLRNQDMRERGWSSIDDQGIRFDNGRPYEAQETEDDNGRRLSAKQKGKKVDRGNDNRISWQDLVGSIDEDEEYTPHQRRPENYGRQMEYDDERRPDEGWGNMHRQRRGHSIVNPVPPSVDPLGVNQTTRHYHNGMRDKLSAILREYLSQPFRFPEGYKPSNQKLPSDRSIEPYKGSERYGELEDFVTTLSIDMSLKGLGGSEAATDRLRIFTLQYYLAGEAKKYYDRQVVSVNRTKYDRTFESVIHAFYDRFVMSTSMHDAREGLKRIRYNSRTGIQGFYDAIMDKAQCMTVHPDDYSLIETFLEGLPEDMRKELFLNQGLMPEMSKLEDFLSFAMAYESRTKVYSYYSRNLPSKFSGDTNYRRNPQQSSRNSTPRPHNSQRFATERANTTPKDHTLGPSKPTGPTFSRSKDRRPERRSTPNASNDRPRHQGSSGPRPQNKSGPSGPTPSVKCYSCGGNHYANACPNKSKRSFVRAAHTVIGESASIREANSDDDDVIENSSAKSERTESEYHSSDSEDEEIETEVVESDYSDDDDFLAMIMDGEDIEVLSDYESDKEDTEEVNSSVNTNNLVMAMTEVGKEPKAVRFRKVTLKKGKDKIIRPQLPLGQKQCLASMINVKGIEAWTLWDSGSTTSGMSPSFANVAGIRVNELVDPHILQLGTVGSRSTVNFGTEADLEIGGKLYTTYLDVANFDRYDMILGTPFMHKYGVLLDFEKSSVMVDGCPIPAEDIVGDADSRIRQHRTTDKYSQHRMKIGDHGSNEPRSKDNETDKQRWLSLRNDNKDETVSEDHPNSTRVEVGSINDGTLGEDN
ncbi:hypothetical protein AGABI2DRAFT_116393 [Agaricus bisporus var. bisporus H97]|uniref:hypothetical protein n=1 Tax=Agaricus bisporus var. bisporus (strain H97 / ATCC MYA-4626 / FGSC 10389) TaxID=936046 RepID=UPI00029F5A67|nr:hypothetical protein AGABI2DRAFT_116393 [Agaricus bisporus var. bisporus H97]EKV49338.1 hypothetical protein AGABI2DRAFT_116393 [Agaricus bisporus var. bisporus H97]